MTLNLNKRERVIEQLRRRYPGGKWLWDGHLYRWRNMKLKMSVHGVSHSISTIDGPSESQHFVSYVDQNFQPVDIVGRVYNLY